MSRLLYRLGSVRAFLPVPSRIDSSALTLVLALGGCGGDQVAAPRREVNPEFEGPRFYEGEFDAPDAPGGPPSGVPGEFVDEQTGGGASFRSDDPCVIAMVPVAIERLPVDVILLLDNSGSMADELEAVEANINVNFASILASSQVDYRVILVSRHRQEAREDSEESSTSICVSSPLSGLSDCSAAEEPVLSERFLQYSTKLESEDSFDVMLDTYTSPFEGSERKDKFDLAPSGWSQWLRAGAKRVILEMTDDNEDMSAESFLEQLATIGPEDFGSDPAHPEFVFHSIVGLAEKPEPTAPYFPDEVVQTETCTGNSNVVQNAGETYQELSRRTGGLRFPLCQFGAYDVVFKQIAEDVVTRRIACDLPVPVAPSGLKLDLANVAIQDPKDASRKFLQALDADSCEREAFYIEGGRLNLCPEECDAIRADPGAQVTVLFMCDSQLIVPR